MMIKVYPSTAPDAEFETHDVHGVTIGEWFDSHDLCREKLNSLPPHVEINGRIVGPEKWDSTYVGEIDCVEIWMQPAGGAFKAIGSLISGAIGLVFGFLMPSQRAPSRRGDPGRGSSLETASAKANEPKLGQVVPEIAGRHIRYPDYLTPPRRRFVSPREQWIEFLACIGPGRYQILPNEIKIGDTQITALGEGAEYEIFEPGQSVAGHSAHEHWHSVAEVGSTSSGTAGLELSVERQSVVNTDPVEYVFSGNTIARESGSFPPGWGPNSVVSVVADITKNYEVTRVSIPPSSVANVFEGDFSHLMPVTNGTQITFTAGPLVGTYIAQDVSLNSSGVGSMQLWTLATNSEPVSSVSNGNYAMTGRIDRNITLTSYSEGLISYSGNPLPEMTFPATIRYQSGDVYGDWTSLIAACPIGEKTNIVELDFFFPQGLSRITDNGDVVSRSVRTEIQYRDSAVGGEFTSTMRTYSASTLNQVGYTWQINVPGIRPEVRVRRVGSITTSTQINDTIQWFGLKSRLETRTSYPNWTTIAIRMRSGGRLGSNAENRVNVIATRILPELVDGQWTNPTPTRDISAFVKYIASTIGYTDADLDMDALSWLNELWRSRGETVDYVFDETTVKGAINTCFAAGMSELTVSDGKIKPVRDDVRTTFETEQGYSPQNMTRSLVRQFKARAADDPDGVEVEFIDSETWEPNLVKCFLPGDQGFKVEKIKIDGVTDRTRAWRIGMRHRSMQRYNRWEYSFSTELDAMNSEYLSYVPLLDDIPGYGQSSILEHIAPHDVGALLFVSEPMNWSGTEQHVVSYRRPDGTVAGPYPASRGDDDYQIIADIPKPWPVVTLNHEPPHVYFGTTERWCFPALITSISPSENGASARVEARNYDVRVYAHDNEQPSLQD